MSRKSSLIDRILSESRKALNKLSKEQLVKLHAKALKWFDFDRTWDEKDRACPKTKKALVQFFLGLDPILAEGGMVDFLYHNRVLKR